MDPTSEQIRQLVVPLFAVTKAAEWHAIGTGFVIVAVGRYAVLVTAGHNLDYFRSLVLPPRRAHPSLPGFLAPEEPSLIKLDGPELVALIRKRGQMDLAVMSHASQITGVDLALVTVGLPEGTACEFERAVAIDSRPVLPIGFPLTAVGYSGLRATHHQDFDRQLFTATANEGVLVARTGKVLSSVEAGGTNRFTGYYVSCPFDSGMSGGPLVELRGGEPFVRAVVTSDLSEDRENQAAGSGERAFASAIWMIAALTATGINVERDDGTIESEPLVRDLIAMNKIRDVGAAHRYVQIVQDARDHERRIAALTWNGPLSDSDPPPVEVSTVPHPTQIMFAAKEVGEILVRNQGIHDGHWILVVKFTVAPMTTGLNGGEPLPTAVVQVPEIGLQRVDAPTLGSIDASIVNPAPTP